MKSLSVRRNNHEDFCGELVWRKFNKKYFLKPFFQVTSVILLMAILENTFAETSEIMENEDGIRYISQNLREINSEKFTFFFPLVIPLKSIIWWNVKQFFLMVHPFAIQGLPQKTSILFWPQVVKVIVTIVAHLIMLIKLSNVLGWMHVDVVRPEEIFVSLSVIDLTKFLQCC